VIRLRDRGHGTVRLILFQGHAGFGGAHQPEAAPVGVERRRDAPLQLSQQLFGLDQITTQGQ